MYCNVIFFQQIQLLDGTFCRTLTQTTLDHLARNNMVRRVGHYNAFVIEKTVFARKLEG